MMSADNAFAAMTADVLSAMGGADQVVYRGADGVQTVTGYVFQQSDIFGVEVPVTEERWLVSLQTADVAEPRRGDRVTDRNGNDWVLQEPVDRDEWLHTWVVSRK